MTQTKEILALTVEIGDAMLRNGSEIYRVEDTLNRIMRAFEVKHFHIYVLANGIFASANENTDDACSMVRHVPLKSPHLGRIAAINHLTRQLCSHECTIEEAWIRLEEYKALPFYGKWSSVLFSGIGCGCFTYLFGGQILDTVMSFFIGMLLQLLFDLLAERKTSRFLTNILASVFVTFLAVMLVVFQIPIQYDKVIIGDIMPLVPGIALTTSIRDFFNGDYLSGAIHMIDAILTAFCIAFGVGATISTFRIVGGALLG